METVCIKDAETSYRSSGYRKMLLQITGKGDILDQGVQ